MSIAIGRHCFKHKRPKTSLKEAANYFTTSYQSAGLSVTDALTEWNATLGPVLDPPPIAETIVYESVPIRMRFNIDNMPVLDGGRRVWTTMRPTDS